MIIQSHDPKQKKKIIIIIIKVVATTKRHANGLNDSLEAPTKIDAKNTPKANPRAYNYIPFSFLAILSNSHSFVFNSKPQNGMSWETDLFCLAPLPSHAPPPKKKILITQPFFFHPQKMSELQTLPQLLDGNVFLPLLAKPLSSASEHHKLSTIYNYKHLHPCYTAPTHSKSKPQPFRFCTQNLPNGLFGSFNGPRNRTRRGPEPESHRVVHAPMKPNLSPAIHGSQSQTLLALDDNVLSYSSLRHVTLPSPPQIQPAQAHIHQVSVPLRPQLLYPIIVPDPIHNRYETREGLDLDTLDPGVSSQEHHVLWNLLDRSLHDAHPRTVVLILSSLPAGPPPPLALRSLQNHEEEAVLRGRNRGEVELRRDWDLPLSLRPGQEGRELLRRDSDLAAHDRLEGLEFQ
jgi:hypothetical protein